VRVIFGVLVVALFCACSFAQSPNGSMGGIVFDPDAKVVVGAEIIVINDLTRAQYETRSNEAGIYSVPNLPPGSYRVQVSKAGFKTLIKPDIVLNVQDAITINFTLPIGAASISIMVEGGAPMIDTTDGAVSTVVDRQFAENLPMNGRSFQTLIYLTPGVVATPSNSGDSGQFSVNGQRADANYWMVDGVSANIGVGATQVGGGNGLGGALGSFSALGGTNSLVSVDALQEFRIQTSTFAPEFGRSPGGQISIVTRSGTNQFHGTAFDYLRNSVFDASNWFNSYGHNPPLPKAEERQNDFGGTFNGPIVKDRTFFFFSYEGLRLRLPRTTLTTVPDVAARSSAVAAVQPYLNAYPLPNGADDPAIGVAQFNASYSDPATLDAYSLRLDDRLTSRWALFGRYNYSPSQLEHRGGSGTSALNVVGTSRITVETGTIGLTGMVSPAFADDLRFNYSRVDAKNYSQMDAFGGAVPLAAVPFPDEINKGDGLFSFSIFGLSTGFNLSTGTQAHATQRQINVTDSVSLEKGKHSLKFGVDFRRLSPTLAPRRYQQVATFRTMAAAEMGTVSSGNVFSFTNESLLFNNLGLYAQDTWRVSPRVTVTYGLRWDVDFAPSTTEGPKLPSVTGYNLVDLSSLAVAPAGTRPFKTTYDNVAPRVGVAYQVSQDPRRQTVVRGGFGVFYDLVNSETGNLLATTVPPFGARVVFRNQTFPYSASLASPPAIPSTATLTDLNVFNPALKLPYTFEWNVAVEQSLGTNQSITASYLGASGRRLLQTTVLLAPPANPQIAQGIFVDNTGASSYDALQLQFRRRLSNGLQALTSYSWSHSIDNASAGSGFVGSDLGLPGSGNANRGNSDFDIRHVLTAGLTYDFPTPKVDRFAKAFLREWSVDNFVLVRSSAPVDLTDENFSEFESGASASVRPDVVQGAPLYLYGSQYPGGKALNGGGFADPPADPTTGNPLRQGNLPRNKLRAFGATQWDFAAHREFVLREPVKLQFRAEMFNVLNHPNFGPPNSQFGTGGFGISTQLLGQSLSTNNSLGGGAFDPLYQIGGPRSIQLALKLTF
jgi:hypothetical protein